MSEQKKIVLTEEHLKSGNVTSVVDQLQRAKEVPLVRAIGVQSKSYDGLITIAVLLAAGLAAGFFTWVAWNALPQIDDATASNLAVSFTLTLVIASVLVLADGALSRSGKKLGMNALLSIPSAIVLALILGLAANALFLGLSEILYNQANAKITSGELTYDEALAYYINNMHLPRGLAWAILGLAAGLSVGIASKAIRRVLITGVGGLLGGFIGGFIFDYIAEAFGGDSSSEDAAQIIGLLVTGGLVGLSVSLLEQVTKQSWIEIVRGGMAGKQFILYQREVTLGSAPTANITLIKDPAIAPIAAVIKRRGSQTVVASTAPNVPIIVNGVAGAELPLSEGAVIQIGSTELRFREKSKKVSNTPIVRG